MKKRTKILVPIDFSPCSENALNYAFRFADRIDATLEILHVATFDAPPLDYPSFVATVTEEKISMSQSRLKKTINRINRDVRALLDHKPEVETDIELGIPDAKIVEVAARDRVDFIIMGTQGQNSVWDRFLGSTAEGVMKYAPCNVIVIPDEFEYTEAIKIGYATDFLDADAFEIWKATKLLQPFQANITAVHLSEKEKFTKGKIDELDEFFKENAPYVNIQFYSFHSKDMAADLNLFIKNHLINLMVMYKPKRNFFERLFHRSFTKSMVRHTEVPLLILKEK